MVNLVRGSTAEPGVWAAAVVPGEVEPEFLPEGSESERDQDEPPGTLGLERPDAPLDHRKTPVLSNGPESVLNAPVTTPATEPSRRELNALVGNEMPGLLTHLPEYPFQESPYRL